MGFGLRVSFLVEKVSNIILYIILIMFLNFFVMLLVAVLIVMNGYGDYLVWNGQKNSFGLYLILLPVVSYYVYRKKAFNLL